MCDAFQAAITQPKEPLKMRYAKAIALTIGVITALVIDALFALVILAAVSGAIP